MKVYALMTENKRGKQTSVFHIKTHSMHTQQDTTCKVHHLKKQHTHNTPALTTKMLERAESTRYWFYFVCSATNKKKAKTRPHAPWRQVQYYAAVDNLTINIISYIKRKVHAPQSSIVLPLYCSSSTFWANSRSTSMSAMFFPSSK